EAAGKVGVGGDVGQQSVPESRPARDGAQHQRAGGSGRGNCLFRTRTGSAAHAISECGSDAGESAGDVEAAAARTLYESRCPNSAEHAGDRGFGAATSTLPAPVLW